MAPFPYNADQSLKVFHKRHLANRLTARQDCLINKWFVIARILVSTPLTWLSNNDSPGVCSSDILPISINHKRNESPDKMIKFNWEMYISNSGCELRCVASTEVSFHWAILIRIYSNFPFCSLIRIYKLEYLLYVRYVTELSHERWR